ncbi:Mediator of RNA polymerase II transcription subunit 13 [Pleurostoma richardsiae]|uniref:Mediator of RNA polymerase II transcription subunit 13 n=1 Tax=Pleurostoma richardsiae TaxID=41990 RepID=A0AA38RV19_9PEZI|nr:Mediator of RNA polymerase II transcription subunit 13 [Pleurostoma richardsiae]
MDAGEYDTNTLLISNISSIAFKIYEPAISHPSSYTFAPSDVENALRHGGHLVYADPVRRSIWCFQLVGKDGGTIGSPGMPALEPVIDICGSRIGVVDEGAFEPANLLKNRPPGVNSTTTPSSSSSSGSALDNNAFRSAQALNVPPSSQSSVATTQDGDSRVATAITADTKGHAAIPVKDIYEHFIAALLSSLSYLFCSKVGAIPLNARSLLLPPAPPISGSENGQPHTPATIGTFRVYLTTTGSLLISLAFSLVHGLASAADSLQSNLMSPGVSVLAGPLGIFGTFQGIADGGENPWDASAVQSPDTQVTRFRPESDRRTTQWRSICSKMLELRGVSSALLNKSSWLTIQSLRRKPLEQRNDGKRTPVMNPSASLVWPSVLCFRKLTARLSKHHCEHDGSSPGAKESFDALNNAKTWYLGNEEREEALVKRKKEREAAALAPAVETDNRAQPNSHSPFSLRRPSNAGPAAGAMYPTPPDGVQNPVGATPSMDGTVSSPGNQAASAAIVDIDTTMVGSGPIADNFGHGWDGTESRREQPQTSFLIQGENLFGDIGEDMFGDANITDADFSFFDEHPSSMDVTLSGLPDIASAMDTSADTSQHFGQFSHNPADTEADIKMLDGPASPVFAKPELKHARSTLTDEGRQRNRALSRTSAAGVKRQPSPFDPDTVYKRVKASLEGTTETTPASEQPKRRGSVFGKVHFDPSVSLLNKKYQDSGRFDVHWDSQKENKDTPTPTTVPTTDYLRRHSKGRGKLTDLSSNMSALMARITGDLENSSIQHSPGRLEDPASDADEVSLVSDQDDSSDFSEEPSSPTKSSVRRRRLDDDHESIATSLRDLDGGADSPAYSTVDLSRLSGLDTPELSLINYFADPDPFPSQLSLADDDFITIAQIITEQAVSGCLKLGHFDLISDMHGIIESRRELATRIRSSIRTLQSILPQALEGAADCQLRPLIEVTDVPLLGQPTRMQPRPTAGMEALRPNLFQIPAPHVEVRRHESQLSVLPSAIGFWESLGLGPSQGAKDIHSICIFPNWDGMSENAGIFMDRLRSVYESLKLGTFERTPSVGGITDGLVPFDADQPCRSPTSAMSRFDQVARVAHALMGLPAVGKNFVVYLVYLPDEPSSIVEACACFKQLFEMYKRALLDRKKAVQNELVLQLVPVDYVATASSLAILAPADYVRLCLETYDRCTLFGGPMPSPAIVLEQPLPRMIEFRLTTTPPTNLLQDNSCIHIAYAQSVDERWVTAAWTDNRGSKQMTASYCLGRKAKPLSTPLADVAHEIWETTHDLISVWKVHWRVIITKCGPMDQQEIDFWIALGQTESKASVSLTLMTVDTNPSLQLIPPAVKIPTNVQSVFYSTPVSTPQASIVSPEQSGTPATPMGAATTAPNATTPGGGAGGGAETGAEADPEATLVDVTDTTWGAVVSHRLNSSASLVELNPALVSGYLVKRGGTRPEDPPVVMEVNILHSEGHARLYEALLREMLTYFRGLGTLARARGLVDRETDVRPWHVAAAEKGVQALYQLM